MWIYVLSVLSLSLVCDVFVIFSTPLPQGSFLKPAVSRMTQQCQMLGVANMLAHF